MFSIRLIREDLIGSQISPQIRHRGVGWLNDSELIANLGILDYTVLLYSSMQLIGHTHIHKFMQLQCEISPREPIFLGPLVLT